MIEDRLKGDMILVLDNEIRPDYRYLGPEIARMLPETEYHVIVEEPDHPPIEKYDGVVLSGSTHSVYDQEDRGEWYEAELELLERCLDAEIPVLGICYGHQLINYALGGEVEHDHRRATFVEMIEYDRSSDGVLEGVNPIVPVLHGDLVTELGEKMSSVARTDYDDNFCTVHDEKPVWTVQFHPEYTEEVVDNTADWDPGKYSFEESTATRVFDNFAEHVARQSRPAKQ